MTESSPVKNGAIMGTPWQRMLVGTLLLMAFATAGSDPASDGEPEASVGAWPPREGLELIGTPAPEWRGIEWIQGGPLSIESLKGRAILLRFWLMDCPFCTNTAPALRELWEEYRGAGLVVVGLHHPKSEAARDPEQVTSAASDLGFSFPIGLDNDWLTIRSYGVGTELRRFTSVSFLIDRRGIIRFVHDGGEFHAGGGPGHEECNAAHGALRGVIEKVLAERGPGDGEVDLSWSGSLK